MTFTDESFISDRQIYERYYDPRLIIDGILCFSAEKLLRDLGLDPVKYVLEPNPDRFGWNVRRRTSTSYRYFGEESQ